ncbi:hypothetical protein QTN25_010814 [Entamoeba marina]
MIIEDTIAAFHDNTICFIGCGPYIKYYHITKSTIILDKVLIYNTLLKTFNLRDPMDYEIIDYNEAKSTDLAEDEELTKLTVEIFRTNQPIASLYINGNFVNQDRLEIIARNEYATLYSLKFTKLETFLKKHVVVFIGVHEIRPPLRLG